MPEIIADGSPFEMPQTAADQYYATKTPPSIGSSVLHTLEDAGTEVFGRAAGRGTVAGSSAFDQGMAALAAQGGAVDQPLVTVPEQQQSPMLAPEQYNELYAPRDLSGKVVPIGDQPMPEALAKIIGQQKADAMQRESVLSRFANTHSGLTTFLVGTAASMLDPLNIAALFVPGIGEGAIAARLGTGAVARFGARVAAGAATGAIQQAPVAALKMALSPEEAGDYGMRDALRDVLYGAAGVAALHAGIGTAGELLGRAAEGVSRETVATPEGEPPAIPAIVTADAQTKNAAMRGAVAEIADGRPVDVGPVLAPSPDAAPDAAATQREGWAPGVAPDELAADTDAVYGPKPETAAVDMNAGSTAAEGVDPELAVAEQKLATIPPESLLPEDQAELDRTAADVETTSAPTFGEALQKAAACIAGIIT